MQERATAGAARAAGEEGALHAVQGFEQVCNQVQLRVSTFRPLRQPKSDPHVRTYSIKSAYCGVYTMATGLFVGLIILWSTVRARVGPPDMKKPRRCAVFLCPIPATCPLFRGHILDFPNISHSGNVPLAHPFYFAITAAFLESLHRFGTGSEPSDRGNVT